MSNIQPVHSFTLDPVSYGGIPIIDRTSYVEQDPDASVMNTWLTYKPIKFTKGDDYADRAMIAHRSLTDHYVTITDKDTKVETSLQRSYYTDPIYKEYRDAITEIIDTVLRPVPRDFSMDESHTDPLPFEDTTVTILKSIQHDSMGFITGRSLLVDRIETATNEIHSDRVKASKRANDAAAIEGFEFLAEKYISYFKHQENLVLRAESEIKHSLEVFGVMIQDLIREDGEAADFFQSIINKAGQSKDVTLQNVLNSSPRNLAIKLMSFIDQQTQAKIVRYSKTPIGLQNIVLMLQNEDPSTNVLHQAFSQQLMKHIRSKDAHLMDIVLLDIGDDTMLTSNPVELLKRVRDVETHLRSVQQKMIQVSLMNDIQFTSHLPAMLVETEFRLKGMYSLTIKEFKMQFTGTLFDSMTDTIGRLLRSLNNAALCVINNGLLKFEPSYHEAIKPLREMIATQRGLLGMTVSLLYIVRIFVKWLLQLTSHKAQGISSASASAKVQGIGSASTAAKATAAKFNVYEELKEFEIPTLTISQQWLSMLL